MRDARQHMSPSQIKARLRTLSVALSSAWVAPQFDVDLVRSLNVEIEFLGAQIGLFEQRVSERKSSASRLNAAKARLSRQRRRGSR